MTWQQIVGVVNILLSIFLVWTLLRSLKIKRLWEATYKDALEVYKLASTMQTEAKRNYDDMKKQMGKEDKTNVNA